MDTLAAEGIRFTDALAFVGMHSDALQRSHRQILLAKPSEKGGPQWLLAGPHRYQADDGRLASETTRYATVCIGKWHLGLGNDKKTDFNKPLVPGPNALGFDYFWLLRIMRR